MAHVYKQKGRKCEFASCGANKRDNPDRRFFKFPVNRQDICEQWIMNCANEDVINYTSAQLKYRCVCDRHFTRSCFTSDMRTTLETDAVPTVLGTSSPPLSSLGPETSPLVTSATSTPSGILSPSPSTSTCIISTPLPSTSFNSTPTTPEKMETEPCNTSPQTTKSSKTRKFKLFKLDSHDTPRKVKLKNALSKYKLYHHRTAMRLKRLQHRDKISNKEKVYSAASKTIISNDFNTLLRMQMIHKRGTQWKEDEKQLAMEMFYRSPGLYNNLRDSKKFKLPAKRTISHWLQVSNLAPGLSDDHLSILKPKVTAMNEKERQVVLMFDEMSIKKSLQYNEKRDIIEGFEDLGPLGRTNQLGTHALLFLVRGLLVKWKLPLTYYIASNNCKGQQLAIIIKNSINTLNDIGLTVRAVVCDQGSNNRNALKRMGISAVNPFTVMNGNKVFFIYDAPHLIKSVRNTLIKSDITFDGGCASWTHIQQLYNLDSAHGLKARSLLKIGPKHINPNSFDRMKVRLATQVFSHSVKAATITAVETSQLPKEALQTAAFVGELNDIFDCLNSRVQFDSNPMRCAISSSDSGKIVWDKLNKALPWINSWKLIKKTKRRSERPPCFIGFVHTITSVLQLWEDLNKQHFNFLLTNRVTQDSLENEFSIVRQRCGYERNPSALRFRQTLRYRIHVSLMKPPETGNCEVDDDPLLTANTSDSEPASDTEGEEDEEMEEDSRDPSLETVEAAEESEDDGSTDDDPDDFATSDSENVEMAASSSTATSFSPTPSTLQQASLETCSVQYVAGYLAKVALQKFDCQHCRDDLTTEVTLDQPNELLILNKSYATKEMVSHLVAPSPLMAAVTDLVLSVFEQNFDGIKHLPSVKGTLVSTAMATIAKHHSEWMKAESPCKLHREFIIDYAMRLKIRKCLYWMSREARMPKFRVVSKKLQILTNM